MEGYIFRFQKDMLDLGAIEMDKTLCHLFKDMDRVELVSGGNERTFSIDHKESIITGRGIKGFFRGFDEGHMFLRPCGDGRFEIETLGSAKAGHESVELLDYMGRLNTDDEKWFQLYRHCVDFFIASDIDRLICLPHLRDVDRYEYQVNTVKSVLNRYRGRVLLGDEVGLGKTVEAGIAMMEYIMRGLARKILILTPPSLVDQWYYEMKRKFNQDFVRYDEPEFKGHGDGAWKHFNKVIASLSTAKRKNHSRNIVDINYDLIIVDEAHHLKNSRTQAWKFVNTLRKKYIFLLTATPVQNNLEELYNLITLLKPGQLKTYSYFRRNFVDGKEGLEAKNVNQLKGLLSNVMIRNRRSDVDIRFTNRFAATYSIRQPEEESQLYDEVSSFIRGKYTAETPHVTRFVLKTLQEEMGSSMAAAAKTLRKIMEDGNLPGEDRERLEEFCLRAERIEAEDRNTGKIKQLVEIIEDFDDKLLVFTKYRATQRVISERLRQQGYSVAEFHGGLRRKEKENQIDYFRRDARVLVSTESGGEGRNLQFCCGMVNFDLPWNPMAIEQRIGRIHRVGQDRDVHVFSLAASNTVEHYILELLDRKINMFELVVGEVDMILGDIEEKSDFSETVMDAWVNSRHHTEMPSNLKTLEDKLLENKKQYMKIKNLDESLFKE